MIIQALLLFLFLLALILFIRERNRYSSRFSPNSSSALPDAMKPNIGDQMKVHLAALESAANGIIITDTRGVVEWVNPGFTRLTGYTSHEIVGRSLKILSSGVHDPEFFRSMWSSILAGNVWHNEVINRRKDGTFYTEEMTITPVLDDQNRIVRFVAVKQDITGRKQLEELMLRDKKRMESELDVAREIQMSMLPESSAVLAGRKDVGIEALLISAREVGGDFYDFFWIDDENICFFVGDVSGKGVPAALLMAVTKTLLKSGSKDQRSTAAIISRVNNELSKDNDKYMFVTVFIGILNTTTGYLVYTNAGHNPAYLLGLPGTGVKRLGELHGPVLGAMEDRDYGETVFQVQRGEKLFVYTDGIVESRDSGNSLYSDERLFSLLSDCMTLPMPELVQKVLDDIKIHEGEAEQADDITMLTVELMEITEDSMLDYLFITISNKIQNIRGLIESFEQFARKQQVPDLPIQQISIVFDELISNTIKYAYPDDLEHHIEIMVRFYRDKLMITLLDDGVPFNPFMQSEPDISLSVQDREVGGLGVHLVKFLVDDYHYEYKSQIGKDSIHFTKNL